MVDPVGPPPSMALTELTAFVGGLRRWAELHPDDEAAQLVLGRASLDLERQMGPWRDAFEDVRSKLEKDWS